MATNPMQRKARSSFILGMFLTLLVTGAIIILLFMQIKKYKDAEKKEQQELEASYKTAYILNKDIESGQNITLADCIQIPITATAIPTDYVSAVDLTENTISKVNLNKGTILSTNLITTEEDKTSDDLRMQEYNMILLPTQLAVGDYIDIRLTLPNGQDYIVISKKKIQDITEDTIWLQMKEEETLIMSNAIVESYVMKGSKLYATIYVEAGMQENATPTYVPSGAVVDLINSNPNIRAIAQERYTENFRARRNNDINSQLGNYEETRQESIEQGVTDEITRMKESREEFFTSANAAVENAQTNN